MILKKDTLFSLLNDSYTAVKYRQKKLKESQLLSHSNPFFIIFYIG